MSKSADRLALLLEQAEAEIEELKQKISEDRDHERWAWARHAELPKKQALPVPRLEIILDQENSDDYNRVWVYRIVYRHFLGHCVAVPLGMTKQSGGNPNNRDLLDLMPFRDGAHIRHDAAAFDWPAFMVRGNESVPIPPPDTDISQAPAGGKEGEQDRSHG